MPVRRSVATLVATASVSVLLLTGCGAAGPSGQTKAQACASLTASARDAADTLSSSYGELQSDPQSAHDAIAAFNKKFKATAAKVTNPDVKKAADKATAGVDKMAEAMQAYIDDPSSDPQPISSAASEVQKDFSAIGTTCAKP